MEQPGILYQLSAYADIAIAIGGLLGGLWALFLFMGSQRLEAARWADSMYRHFYHSKKYEEIRLDFEYRFFTALVPVLQKRVSDRHLPLSEEEMQKMQEIDSFLNHFEHLLALVKKRQMSRRDALDPFEYWLSLMRRDRYAVLRTYIDYGFENLEDEVDAKRIGEFFLTQNQVTKLRDGAPELWKLIGALNTKEAQIRDVVSVGQSYSLGMGDDCIDGTVFICDNEINAYIHAIDQTLGHDPEFTNTARCLRVAYRVYNIKGKTDAGLDAWVYAESIGADSEKSESLGKIIPSPNSQFPQEI